MEIPFLVRLVLAAALVGAGALLVWSARSAASGRLRRNPIAGIRVPSTMASDEAWLAAHRRAKTPTVIAGGVAIGGGLLALLPTTAPVLAVIVLGATAIVLALVIAGSVAGIRAASRPAPGDES